MRLQLPKTLPDAERLKAALRDSPGVAGTLLLHGLFALALLLYATGHHAAPSVSQPQLIPIDLVRLGEETTSPEAAQHSVLPQQKASTPRKEASPVPEAISPTGRKPAPEDALDAKLRALARLRQPDSKLKLEGTGESNVAASNGGAPGEGTYSIRDYVRAQIERRWSLDLARLAGRNFVIPIRIVMKHDGTIASAEIVDLARSKTDVIYRDIAISARNAALLSSPINLPPGDYPKEMHLTLALNPRDTVR
jgi:hypothetical protein